MPGMAPDLLAMHAASVPDKPAIIDDRPGQPPRTWTFPELDAWANRLARLLIDLGVKPGDKVISCGQNSGPLLAIGHGARRAGAISVPLNYRLTAEEAAYIIENSDASVVYVDAEFAGLIEGLRARLGKLRHVLVFDGDGALEARLASIEPGDTGGW